MKMTPLIYLKIEQYLIRHLPDLAYIGDLRKEDGSYLFNTKALSNKRVSFDNSIFKVVEIEYNHFDGCSIVLEVSAHFVEFAVFRH